jgi:hypothetical protein
MSTKHWPVPRQDRRGKGRSPVMRHDNQPGVGTENRPSTDGGNTAPGGNCAEPVNNGGAAWGDISAS